MNHKIFLLGKLQIISNVLSTTKYAVIAIISGLGLGIIYYFLTMSMLPMHFDLARSYHHCTFQHQLV